MASQRERLAARLTLDPRPIVPLADVIDMIAEHAEEPMAIVRDIAALPDGTVSGAAWTLRERARTLIMERDG